MKSIFAKTIYTGKKIISDAYLVFDHQKIITVSTTEKGHLRGKFSVITPAFVDAHSHIGMARAGEPSDQGEANDMWLGREWHHNRITIVVPHGCGWVIHRAIIPDGMLIVPMTALSACSAKDD